MHSWPRSPPLASRALNDVSIRLVAYDVLWPREFEAEAERLARACDGLPLRLEHIGSTAVPGLSGKPLIDILAGVPPRAARAPYIAALVQLGYEHLGAYGVPGRDYFRRGNPRTHHVHMVSWSSKTWRDHLLFRDYLRAHPHVALEYAALKRELAAAFPDDGRKYAEEKGPFIKSVVRAAEGHRRR
jgi:GrpB-like predicted nucleotidyltransferase (UPF0157 family)